MVSIPIAGQDVGDQFAVADIADHQADISRHQRTDPGRQIVQDNRLEASIQQSQNGVAADVARAPGDQDFHGCIFIRLHRGVGGFDQTDRVANESARPMALR